MNKASFLIRKIIRGPIPDPEDYIFSTDDRSQTINKSLVEAEEILNALISYGNKDKEKLYRYRWPSGLCEMIHVEYLLALLKWFAPLFPAAYYFPFMSWNIQDNTVFNIDESVVPRIKLMNEIVNYLKFGI